VESNLKHWNKYGYTEHPVAGISNSAPHGFIC